LRDRAADLLNAIHVRSRIVRVHTYIHWIGRVLQRGKTEALYIGITFFIDI